jgi:predicted transcriptional regulator
MHAYADEVIEVPNYAQILKERGLSLGEFAKAVGFSKTYVAEVLAGKREVPPETEEKILAGFDTCHWCKRGWPHPRPKVVRTKRKGAA